MADDVKRQPVDAGGVPAEWITVPGAAKERVIYYLHGGGYSGFRTQDTDIGVSFPDVPEKVAHSGSIRSQHAAHMFMASHPAGGIGVAHSGSIRSHQAANSIPTTYATIGINCPDEDYVGLYVGENSNNFQFILSGEHRGQDCWR